MHTTSDNTPCKHPVEPASLTGPTPLLGRVARALLRAAIRFREFNAAQVEAKERLWLLQRPWEEEFLHWSRDGDGWQLHGHKVPPKGRHSITSTGWCQNAR